MKKLNLNKVCRNLLICLALTGVQCINSQTEKTPEDKTLSPYFFVKSDSPNVDKLPLESTSAEVNIAGVIADVKVTQVYKNEGKNTLEAIYVFPASTRAAVYSMRMTIGDRIIDAKIKEKEQARQEYNEAIKQGKTASLLEQHRPNVFQMNVGNILPGDRIKVEMFYTELLVPEDGIYEFVYPTVVGPRYSNQTAEENPSDKWVENPYTEEAKAPMYTFDIKVNIAAGMPLKEVRSISHDLDFKYSDASNVTSKMKAGQEYTGNKDVIVQYRLQGEKIESGLLMYKGKEENFFLAMVQPPKRIVTSVIPPREYVFIVDVSGSMSGFPLEISKTLLKDLIGNLKPTDKFNVILFAGTTAMLSEKSLPANQENIKKAIDVLDNQRGGGGTQLLPALKTALALKGTENYSRSFIIATDGYVTVEKEAFELIRNNLGEANFFSFGLGSSVNRHIIEGMAHVGAGESFVITKPENAAKKAAKFRQYIQYPVLTNIEVSYNGLEAYDIEPLSVPDVLAERPVLIYGKWKGTPSGSITLKGITGAKDYTQTLKLSDANISEKNKALRYLWARQRIMILDDFNNLSYNEEHKKEITNMGIKYNLLTNYTSFIAIDNQVRNEDGKVVTVKQALPLPEGVSNMAIGRNSGYISGKKYKSMSKSNYYGSGVNSPAPIVSEDLMFSSNELIDVKEEEEKEEIMMIVEKMPLFDGKENIQVAIQEFIKLNIKHPGAINGANISGTVYVEFTINVKGELVNAKIIRGLHPDYDNEALRVINLTSKMWTAGEHKGKAVNVGLVIPVKFNL